MSRKTAKEKNNAFVYLQQNCNFQARLNQVKPEDKSRSLAPPVSHKQPKLVLQGL